MPSTVLFVDLLAASVIFALMLFLCSALGLIACPLVFYGLATVSINGSNIQFVDMFFTQLVLEERVRILIVVFYS